MRLRTFALILASTLLTTACGNAAIEQSHNTGPASSPAAVTPAGTPDQLASARINFQKNCVTCHGEKAEGGLKEVEGKRFKVPSLREGHALEHTDEKFVKQINEGDEEMPAFKEKLSAAEINDLVRFIRKEFQGK
ncbi:MAG: cytochrome c [Pyrinomonadaceae bacterium]